MAGGDRDKAQNELRARAESLLQRGRPSAEVVHVLERLCAEAAEGSEAHIFACRHLAEVYLEVNPWRAALNLRRILAHQKDDDVAHALMGLAQALLGNFRAAVSSYRRALQVSPRNPWYHHNVGHLLDVALGDGAAALPHLRTAHRLEPGEDEITASLAHCLARLGALDEAWRLADEAVRSAPKNGDHRALLAWIEAGARAEDGPHAAGLGRGDGVIAATADARRRRRRRDAAQSPARTRKAALTDEAVVSDTVVGREGSRRRRIPRDVGGEVAALLERHMPAAGYSARALRSARSILGDYAVVARLRSVEPAVLAAAVECALLILDPNLPMSRGQIAARYGVNARALVSCATKIASTLALRPGDPRY
jgi:thioredoxin-like negative regulator of GroEL